MHHHVKHGKERNKALSLSRLLHRFFDLLLDSELCLIRKMDTFSGIIVANMGEDIMQRV